MIPIERIELNVRAFYRVELIPESGATTWLLKFCGLGCVQNSFGSRMRPSTLYSSYCRHQQSVMKRETTQRAHSTVLAMPVFPPIPAGQTATS